MPDRFTRRSFIETVATGAAVTDLADADESAPIPTRVLGKTGAKVTIVALGCGNGSQRYGEEGAIQAIHTALDQGIGYIDTAFGYGRSASENVIHIVSVLSIVRPLGPFMR
jgi:hypothetical protein